MGKLLFVWLVATSLAISEGARLTPPPTPSTTMPPSPSTVTVNLMEAMTPLAPSCPESNHTPLGRLRNAMRNPSVTQLSAMLDAFVVFFSDEHLSDEPAPEERRLEYISGWDGMGTAAVVATGAALWVPAGDLARARASLSCEWVVLDADDSSQPTVGDWIAERIGRNGRIGGDARLTSVTEWQAISATLQRDNHQLVHVPTLIDQLWMDEPDPERRRPAYSKIVAKLHDVEYTGMTWREKVSIVRDELRALGADAMVVTALDEVAWLLNIRGRDVPYAPLLKAFVIISHRDIRVFTPPGKLSMPVREILAVYNCFSNNCTKVDDYSKIYSELRRTPEAKILIPTAGTFQRGASAAIAQSVPTAKRFFQLSPIIYLKAMKNEAEAKGMRKAHLRDAVAMCTLFSYIENKHGLNELSVAKNVDVTRETQAGFVGASMRTRVAFATNGADPYYRPTSRTNTKIFRNGTLVIQSGGQYMEGTTEVSRTVHFGSPTRDERRAYTTVLRSVAALASLSLPAELPAAHADPVARAPLWAARHDYSHPTGHGVGAALNRKEDPVVLDYRQDTNLHTFREGYFVSVEPGWYDMNKFGIQLGNVLEVVMKPNFYLGFKETTLMPYEPKLIDKSMLTEYEINWLNSYNDRIRKTVGPELKAQGLTDVYYWMMNKTIPLEVPSQKLRKAAGSAHKLRETCFSVLVTLIATLYCVHV